ncbi:MAG: lipocalin family protein [Alistipes sp.]|nr:lipocalin family protein [Alistipes sp.]
MRHLKQLLLIMVGALLTISCQGPEPQPQPTPGPDVTYEAMEGVWRLEEWNGEELIDGAYLFIEFSTDKRFEMWDNLGSMYPQLRTGRYSISQNDNNEFVLTGTYDNGVGDWANSYKVSMQRDGEDMLWSTDTESMLFSFYIGDLPEIN